MWTWLTDSMFKQKLKLAWLERYNFCKKRVSSWHCTILGTQFIGAKKLRGSTAVRITERESKGFQWSATVVHGKIFSTQVLLESMQSACEQSYAKLMWKDSCNGLSFWQCRNIPFRSRSSSLRHTLSGQNFWARSIARQYFSEVGIPHKDPGEQYSLASYIDRPITYSIIYYYVGTVHWRTGCFYDVWCYNRGIRY